MPTDEILKTFGPYVLAILGTFVGYYLGRRSKFDDIRIGKGFELAEEVSRLFQDVAELETSLFEFYRINFAEREDGYRQSVEDAVDSFLRLKPMYRVRHEEIEKLSKKRERLIRTLKRARLYLDNRTISMMNRYLKLGDFQYMTDGGVMTNTYHLGFFRNLIDPRKHRTRKRLRKAITKRLRKLVR